MSLLTQANLSEDTDLMRRVAACAASCGVKETPPTSWAIRHLWTLAATPGWVDAYQQALDDGIERPGEDPDVITDLMIHEAVHALVNPEEPEDPGDPDPAE